MLRFAGRMLWKESGFTLVAVLTLALGIGATSAIFSLIQGVLLTPPPYRQPDQLVLIPSVRTDGQPMAQSRPWPAAQWIEWGQEAKSFEAIAAYNWSFNFLVLPGGSESVEGMVDSQDMVHVQGLDPLLGRTFVKADEAAKPAPVLILGYDLWQRKFNGTTAISWARPSRCPARTRRQRLSVSCRLASVFFPPQGPRRSRITT